VRLGRAGEEPLEPKEGKIVVTPTIAIEHMVPMKWVVRVKIARVLPRMLKVRRGVSLAHRTITLPGIIPPQPLPLRVERELARGVDRGVTLADSKRVGTNYRSKVPRMGMD
jgi:hypothetical protein